MPCSTSSRERVPPPTPSAKRVSCRVSSRLSSSAMAFAAAALSFGPIGRPRGSIAARSTGPCGTRNRSRTLAMREPYRPWIIGVPAPRVQAVVRVPIGTTSGVPATGSGMTRASSPKTSESSGSVRTSPGSPALTIRPSFIATSRSE
jgi:hypothetical protein